ncbi:phenol 2-monooxygenase [Pyrenophora seminiperda CCB06]|uniref:Phenol 2-monooxygenase n=1 Tax=Pyrenophora seminiperda CCB06 TaxID=1302712 RepID=A0A3M7MA35_9PLEO|nr:phenol 2-monooxygenase [Pyrenophora seminiperda CCB06]
MPKTDVLIAGSGSAGIFAATWLAIYNIPFTVLERRDGPLKIGQADGVQVRTVEIYESFGLSEGLLREAYHILEVCFWGFDEDANGKAKGDIRRKSRSIDTEPGLSHLPHVILNQARMNGLMLGKMESVLKQNGRWKEGTSNGIEYGWAVKALEIDESKKHDPNAHCVKVTASKEGKEEVWEAKYVLGCDGAHSTIRKALDIRMLGDTSDTVWGVMDIYPLTNFPDIRRKCTIHSTSGNLLIIPREGGQLVRFYIQLPAGVQPKTVKLAHLQDQARRIFAPYSMDFAGVFWWSAYSIGQRLASAFHAHNRVFLTGDACHTHSPKAGQGMNVSLQDGYNIGWKLGSVLAGLSPPSLIPTYVSERSKTAADLIAFDKELAKMFSRKEAYEGEFADYFVKSGRYMAGFTAKYEDSMIISGGGGGGGGEELARGVTVGMRFPSAQVVRFCDCKAVQLQSVVRSDGRWRVVVFGGDGNRDADCARLRKLATSLEKTTRTHTPSTKHLDSVIEPLLVLSSKFTQTEQERIPDFFWPKTGEWGIRDLHKTYIDDTHPNAGHGHAYKKYGIDPSVGAVVLVRPDQYVAKVTSMEDGEGIAGFFGGCLVVQDGGVERRVGARL